MLATRLGGWKIFALASVAVLGIAVLMPTASRWVTRVEPNERGVNLRVAELGATDEVVVHQCSVSGSWVSGECAFLE